MRLSPVVAALAALAIAPPVVADPSLDDRRDASMLPLDRPTEIGGVRLACTGVGEARTDPRWLGYAVRIEVSNARGEYLAGEQVTLRDIRGRELFTVACDDPWVLADLAPGRYVVEARLQGHPDLSPSTTTIRVPPRGQVRIVLQFPEAD